MGTGSSEVRRERGCGRWQVRYGRRNLGVWEGSWDLRGGMRDVDCERCNREVGG